MRCRECGCAIYRAPVQGEERYWHNVSFDLLTKACSERKVSWIHTAWPES